jgi:D-aminopeptidase
MRARDLGIEIGRGTPGPHNAITDVPGVRVGHATIISGEDIRTGVTVVLPHPEDEPLHRPVFAGSHILNGNGELTGLEWVRDSGTLTTPVAMTNTFSVGTVRDAIARLIATSDADAPPWLLPVVGETYDGILNAITKPVIGPEHVAQAFEAAGGGDVVEGCVGAGTGTICHGFKGGIGTASRLADAGETYTVGVLVQTNHGRRERLTVNGVQVGAAPPLAEVPAPGPDTGAGSIIVAIATDAPLLPHQCAGLARRASLGIARVGGTGESSSGDLLVAFATGNRLPTEKEQAQGPPEVPIRTLAGLLLDPLYDAVIDATQEAILNSLTAAETMRGRDGAVAYAIDHAQLRALL